MRTIIRAALAACVLVSLAACSSGGETPAAAPSTMSDAEILALGKQVAECIRANGVPDFPDPFVDKGKLKLPEGSEDTMEQRYSQQVLEQAEQSCQALMDRIPESAIKSDDPVQGDGNDQAPGTGDVEALKKFAQCMRENGFADWPDPKPDGSFPLRGTALETEGKSERFGRAAEACQQYWNGGMRIS